MSSTSMTSPPPSPTKLQGYVPQPEPRTPFGERTNTVTVPVSSAQDGPALGLDKQQQRTGALQDCASPETTKPSEDDAAVNDIAFAHLHPDALAELTEDAYYALEADPRWVLARTVDVGDEYTAGMLLRKMLELLEGSDDEGDESEGDGDEGDELDESDSEEGDEYAEDEGSNGDEDPELENHDTPDRESADSAEPEDDAASSSGDAADAFSSDPDGSADAFSSDDASSYGLSADAFNYSSAASAIDLAQLAHCIHFPYTPAELDPEHDIFHALRLSALSALCASAEFVEALSMDDQCAAGRVLLHRKMFRMLRDDPSTAGARGWVFLLRDGWWAVVMIDLLERVADEVLEEVVNNAVDCVAFWPRPVTVGGVGLDAAAVDDSE